MTSHNFHCIYMSVMLPVTISYILLLSFASNEVVNKDCIVLAQQRHDKNCQI